MKKPLSTSNAFLKELQKREKNSECHFSIIYPEIQVPFLKVVDELLAYWTLESSEDTLEELEDALIVSPSFLSQDVTSQGRRCFCTDGRFWTCYCAKTDGQHPRSDSKRRDSERRSDL